MDDVVENDGDKQTLTLNEYLDDLEEQEMEAEMVLGGDDGDECTYSKGYLKRQAIFSCLSCTPEGDAGICTACSLICHEKHEIIELWTKRNFRCDCGNSKFGNFICKLQAGKDIENVENMYNHNFKGTYCTCDRPYPDPSVEEEEEMVQCCVCEDWFHQEHLGLESSEKIPVDEEGEPIYEDLICLGCSETCSFLALYPQNIFVAPKKTEVVASDKGKGKLEDVPSICANAEKVMAASEPVKLCVIGDIKPEKVLSKNKCTQEGSSGTSCQLGFDLGAAQPPVERSKAMFLIRNWREVLCRCENCTDFYKQKKVGFLLDKEDSIAEYEKRAKERREERLQKQEGASLNMFNNLGHVEKVEIMSGIAEMKNEMETFFANRDTSQAVTSSDIYQLFDNLKKKRRRE